MDMEHALPGSMQREVEMQEQNSEDGTGPSLNTDLRHTFVCSAPLSVPFSSELSGCLRYHPDSTTTLVERHLLFSWVTLFFLVHS